MDRELVLIVALNPGVGAIAHVEMNSAFRRTAKPVFLPERHHITRWEVLVVCNSGRADLFGFIVFQVI